MVEDSNTQLVFCGTGWHALVDVIRPKLPEWASIRIRNPSRAVGEELRDADVLLPSNMVLDQEGVRAPENLILIMQPAAGFERIDLEAARERKVPVCHVPGVNTAAMAEAALFLMLALARQFHPAQREFARGALGGPTGVDLEGKTVGIIGLGRTGRHLAQVTTAMGMQVVSVGSSSSRDELLELLGRADFVSLHCPLTPQTRGLLGTEEFQRMKPGAFLVNCSRAQVVDRDALAEALESGRLAGAGIDVHWQEPWDAEDSLYRRENVIAMPHIGGSTAEAFDRTANIIAENVRRIVDGKELLHQIA